MSASIRMPWDRDELILWSIVGMNHYWMDGRRHLFVAMTWENHCIRAEGVSEALVFETLAKQAKRVEGTVSDHEASHDKGGRDVAGSGLQANGG